jgi:hypothetical protein
VTVPGLLQTTGLGLSAVSGRRGRHRLPTGSAVGLLHVVPGHSRLLVLLLDSGALEAVPEQLDRAGDQSPKTKPQRAGGARPEKSAPAPQSKPSGPRLSPRDAHCAVGGFRAPAEDSGRRTSSLQGYSHGGCRTKAVSDRRDGAGGPPGRHVGVYRRCWRATRDRAWSAGLRTRPRPASISGRALQPSSSLTSSSALA